MGFAEGGGFVDEGFADCRGFADGGGFAEDDFADAGGFGGVFADGRVSPDFGAFADGGVFADDVGALIGVCFEVEGAVAFSRFEFCFKGGPVFAAFSRFFWRFFFGVCTFSLSLETSLEEMDCELALEEKDGKLTFEAENLLDPFSLSLDLLGDIESLLASFLSRFLRGVCLL